jgi:hypothetical protein
MERARVISRSGKTKARRDHLDATFPSNDVSLDDNVLLTYSKFKVFGCSDASSIQVWSLQN